MTISYNSQAWLKERTLIKISGLTATQVKAEFAPHAGLSTITSYYDAAADGSVTIDVTDLLHVSYAAEPASGNDLVCTLTEWNGAAVGTAQTASFKVAGLTNPSGWLMPTHPNADGYAQVYATICPPTMILQPIVGIQSLIALYNTNDCPDNPDYYILYNRTGASVRIHALNNILPINDTHREVRFIKVTAGSGVQKAEINITPLLCNRKYAAIEWTDRLGLTKRTTWEVRGITENTLDAVALQTMDNSYDTRKGAEVTATLHLSNLSAYDVWYYADIVTSSRVRMQMSAADTPVQVDVITKKVDIPNGDAAKELYSLDVEIKYKRYDTI